MRRTLTAGAVVVLVAAGGCVSTSKYNRKVAELQEARKEQQAHQAEVKSLDDLASALAANPGLTPEEAQDRRELLGAAAAPEALCSRWDCTRRCCKRIFGVLVCEPTCKSMCELHNLGCEPSVCQVVKAADPSYDTLKQGWQAAKDAGVFCGKSGCDQVAQLGYDAVGFICKSVGGPWCTLGNVGARVENECICSELDYRAGCTGPTPGPGTPPPECGGGVCCERRRGEDGCHLCRPKTGSCP